MFRCRRVQERHTIRSRRPNCYSFRSDGSDVEADVHDVPVCDDVVFALDLELARRAAGTLGEEIQDELAAVEDLDLQVIADGLGLVHFGISEK